MPYLTELDADTGLIDANIAPNKGSEYEPAYGAARPFPHVVIDDFLPKALLERCASEFPSELGVAGVRFDRAQEQRKTHFNPDLLPTFSRTLFYTFNSRPFVRLIENISGIKRLIPDPFFLGAGLHETTQGGYLNIHADFNHHRPMDVERRINVLIYLNQDWEAEYGGQLELWNADMSLKVVSVVPAFNRCVIFNTDSKSFHGNPEPVAHPRALPRRSIALYYYTSTWADTKEEHTTRFRARAHTRDQLDWSVRSRELLRDLTPPALYRLLARAR
jgi:hypothetical protein